MIMRRNGDRHAAQIYSQSRGKKIWTPEEDIKLRELISLHGTGNWTIISDLLPERTGKQCRERFHNHLNPGIKKGEWTEEEDSIIFSMQKMFGNQWAKITKRLPGRTDNAVKNRFHATARARQKGGNVMDPAMFADVQHDYDSDEMEDDNDYGAPVCEDMSKSMAMAQPTSSGQAQTALEFSSSPTCDSSIGSIDLDHIEEFNISNASMYSTPLDIDFNGLSGWLGGDFSNTMGGATAQPSHSTADQGNCFSQATTDSCGTWGVTSNFCDVGESYNYASQVFRAPMMPSMTQPQSQSYTQTQTQLQQQQQRRDETAGMCSYAWGSSSSQSAAPVPVPVPARASGFFTNMMTHSVDQSFGDANRMDI